MLICSDVGIVFSDINTLMVLMSIWLGIDQYVSGRSSRSGSSLWCVPCSKTLQYDLAPT